MAEAMDEALDGLRLMDGGGEAILILLCARPPPADLAYPEDDDTDIRLRSSAGERPEDAVIADPRLIANVEVPDLANAAISSSSNSPSNLASSALAVKIAARRPSAPSVSSEGCWTPGKVLVTEAARLLRVIRL